MKIKKLYRLEKTNAGRNVELTEIEWLKKSRILANRGARFDFFAPTNFF
jgi:hypothetical protein